MRKFGFLSAFMLIIFICSTTGFAHEKPKYQVLFSGGAGLTVNDAMYNSVNDTISNLALDYTLASGGIFYANN